MPSDVTDAPPTTIVLALWPFAQAEQIEYYVQGYEKLYPCSKIVLIQHFENAVQSAIAALSNENEKPPQVDQHADTLIHLFGDDAADQVWTLLRAHLASTGRPLAVKTIIFDSAPTPLTLAGRSLPFSPRLFIIYCFIAIITFWGRFCSSLALLSRKRSHTQTKDGLHTSEALPTDVRRAYVFPDRMFAWSNSSDEDDAGDRHDSVFRREKVGPEERWNGDQEQFWLGIEDAWNVQ